MRKLRVAVVGASGLVGAALCERLFFERDFEPIAVLHSIGRAARVARLGIQVRVADLLDRDEVLQAISGCEYVVNCSRGDAAVMIKGLTNLVRAARNTETKRLIHLSSTAIYGNPAPGALITEHTPPQPSDEYAAIKLRQDRIVLGEHASRLHCIVLCPPTIFGPYSPFTVDVSESIREGRLPLLDGGTGFANLIHVDNLVHAIVTAMASDHGWGERYLVNEVEKISWVRFFEDMRLMLGAKSEFIKISSSQAGPMLSSGESRHRRGDSLRILVSGEFRAALSQFPIFRKLNEGAYKWFSSTRPWFQTWIRRRFQRPITISKQRIVAPVDQYFVRMQSRKVYFSPERLVGTFDYQPVLTYKQSMRTLRLWLEFANLI